MLLVDASQGIQAQTLSTLYMAMENDLTIIPVLNKIDLPAADPEARALEIERMLGIDKSEIIAVSAKTGQNVEQVLDAVIERVPGPEPLVVAQETIIPSVVQQPIGRALIFDSMFDPYKGVVAYVKVLNGEFKQGDHTGLIYSTSNPKLTEV